MSVISRCLAFVCLFVCCAAWALPASGPSITLISPSATAWETEESTVALQGSAKTESGVANVLWVNQFGQRGSGTWSAAGGQTSDWVLPEVPVRLGVNLITVTVVDVNNHSASLHVAVNRKPPAGTRPAQPLEIRTGTWQNRPIVYQLWNGQPVVEGDMILNLSVPEKPGSRGPAAAMQGVVTNGLAISYTSQLWPMVSGIYQVPYIITGSSSNLTTAISTFNQRFSGLIQFVARSAQTNYVNITVENSGSGEGYSKVGMAGGEQTLDCGGGCSVATWLHEMGHTVGLLHEHQRPDRANYITLHLANADLPNIPGNFTLFSFDYQTIGLYDYASVMHYGAFDFSKAGLPVLESIPSGIPLSNDTGYSAGDTDQIERLYGATPSAVTVTTNPIGLQIVVDGTTYTAPQTFSWSLNSTHTLNVPADPQTTNPADGSTYAFGNWNDLGVRSHTIAVQPGPGTLTAPANKPGVTLYEANFIRLQPFSFQSPSVYPSTAGTVAVTPTPTSEYGGSFFTDRTLVTLTLTPTQGSGYNFYDWFNLPYPPSDNPHSFYIQAPTTQAQAVFVSTPVTIVGESITGPNAWNPGLAGTVDGSFTYFPTAFSSYYNGSGWNAGTTHAIAVDQQQSPITTNIFYNWNTWSDGGAISHNIVQPNSGSQTISASFTPFYAFYTIPAALGSPNASCYGGVTTSPAGTSYPANSAFDFYQDGTSVTTTATANSQYPGMVFAGWTGSLSGNTNPQTTTIHDQFVPTANFNLSSTPLTITSLNPSSAPARASALDVTINGTGFTSGSTYVYWNGSYRASTFVSSSQLTVHLNAGDLANAGGQDVQVGNYVTNSSNSTCGVTAETSFTVTLSGTGGSGASAKYNGLDTTTQGTWTGKYGTNGYLIANDATSPPAYATVNLTGATPYTWTASTSDSRALQVSSGSSTRIASTYYSYTNFTIDVNLTDGNAHRIALYLLDWSSTTRTESVSILDASSKIVLDTETFSGFHNGEYAAWNVQGHVLIQVKLTGGTDAVVSGIFFDPVPTSSASAKYNGADTATQGTWTGKYGADGYLIANDATHAPAYATLSLTGATPYTWTASTTDPRALQTASGSSTRIASAYYSYTNFSIDVNLTDGNAHRIALYLLDWSSTTRTESISILDAGSNAVLDTETFSGFHNGEYAAWNVKGHVLIRVTLTGGTNAVVSGIFFDPASTPSASATYNGLDTATQGTWTGKYGADGYLIANDATNAPAYATVSLTGDTPYTWTASTTDPRALQVSSGSSNRIASTYYSYTNFTIDVNLTDGNAHPITLYLLDWSSTTRAETVSIVDAASNTVLDTETFSGFHNGEYAAWNVKGHVLIRVTLTGGTNAVVSGIFFK